MGAGDYGYWQGAERATGQALATGMGLLHYQAQRNDAAARLSVEQQRLKIAQDTAEQQNRALKIQADQATKDAELIPVDTTLSRLGFSNPDEQAHFKSKALLHIENIGGVDYIQRGQGTKLLDTYSKDPVFNVEIGTLRTNNLNKNIDDIKAKLDASQDHESGVKLKPEQQQALQQQYDGLIQQRTAVANALKVEQQRVRAQFKESMKPMYDAKENKWYDVNTVTGDKVDLGGMKPETAYTAEQNRLSREEIAAEKNDLLKALAAAKAGDKDRSGPSKAQTESLKRLDQFFSNNEREIRRLQSKGEATDNLEAAQQQIQDTKAQILDGTIDPKSINWGNKINNAAPQDRWSALVSEAKQAIAQGANKNAVIKRLREKGYKGTL